MELSLSVFYSLVYDVFYPTTDQEGVSLFLKPNCCTLWPKIHFDLSFYKNKVCKEVQFSLIVSTPFAGTIPCPIWVALPSGVKWAHHWVGSRFSVRSHACCEACHLSDQPDCCSFVISRKWDSVILFFSPSKFPDFLISILFHSMLSS